MDNCHKVYTGRTPRVQRRSAAWAVIAAIALAGCVTPPVTAPLPPQPSYRDQSVPIGVTSRFDAAKFAGPWQVRAVLPQTESFQELALFPRAGGAELRIAADVCDAAGICGRFAQALPTKVEGKGRYLVTMPSGVQRRIWVLWVDEGFRTAILGNPEGTFAWLIDRSRTGGADRIRAAREILDFNGYNPSQLKGVK